jgi:UDPglucose 6-dehydrogenase
MKIGILGMGFVGGTTAKVLSKAHEILPYDRYKKEYQNPTILRESEVAFICVPTPMKRSGEIDSSAIYHSIGVLENVLGDVKPLIVIRSTAVSGTTDELAKKYPSFHFAFNPEFLREKYALEDMLNTDRVLIGADNQEDYKKVEQVYKPIFPNAEYIHQTRREIEMVKYASNVMLTSQIAIANEVYQICQAFGIDYGVIKDIVLKDNRIGRNIQVPGPDGQLGFGGKCFPKDLNALIYLSTKKGYDPHLLKEVWRLNKRVRKDKDWLNIPGATSQNNDFK